MTLLTNLMALGSVAGALPTTTVYPLDGDDWNLTAGAGAGGTSITNATVPGGVWDNMHRAGIIGDPLYRQNDLVFYNVTTGRAGGWTFSKSFSTPAGASGATTFVQFAGIQGLATISVNGVKLESTNNQFRLYRVVVPSRLLLDVDSVDGKQNVLTVHIDAVPPPYPNNGAFPDTLHNRNEADAWGWDWSPDLNPMQIYGPVRLKKPPPTHAYAIHQLNRTCSHL
jgi:beta-mannosidase